MMPLRPGKVCPPARDAVDGQGDHAKTGDFAFDRRVVFHTAPRSSYRALCNQRSTRVERGRREFAHEV